MKRYFILVILLVLFPLLNVEALSCYGDSIEKPINLDNIDNFQCSGVEGDTLTFKYNNEDYSKYFEYQDGTISIVDKNLVFDENIEIGIIVVSDAKTNIPIYIKNKAYVVPKTTTTTTTTTNANEITYTVILDKNDGSEQDTKTCSVKAEGDVCYVTLPTLDKEYFNGWGSAKTCKEGNTGSIRVDKDTTYYACYTNNENENNPDADIYLKGLEIFDEKNEKIDFGTFSMKKTSYEFKVLNEVENLLIESEIEEGHEVEISGNENLKVGENEVTITLKDSSNNTKEYKLVVTRLEEGETISNVNYLSALVIGNVAINFNKDTFVYNVTISSDLNKLEINAVAENNEDKIEILGNENIVDGSSIKVNVIGDENTTTYTINVTKESSNNILLFVAIGVIILLIILLIVLIIIKSKKNKKQKNNSKPETIQNNSSENNIEVLKF